MSVVIWVMVGIAIWHFTVLVPDRFAGGIIGAFLVSVAGALATGYLLPSPGIPAANPPGIQEALWANSGDAGSARRGVRVWRMARQRAAAMMRATATDHDVRSNAAASRWSPVK
jgi:hypothetical protein